MDTSELRRASDALASSLRTVERRDFGVTVGSDPEFTFRRDGRFVPADHVLVLDGMLGCDGCPTTGELRPKPDKSVVRHVAGIRWIFSELHKADPTLDVFANAYDVVSGATLGGHIHFDWWPTRERAAILRNLDFVLYDCITLTLEDKEAGRARRRSYGTPYKDDTDDSGPSYEAGKAHGGFEYRTPPTWLNNPALALQYLAGAKASVYFARAGRELAKAATEAGFEVGAEGSVLPEQAAWIVRGVLYGVLDDHSDLADVREARDFLMQSRLFFRRPAWNATCLKFWGLA